jgi:uncharacterized protein (UPF0548 family)
MAEWRFLRGWSDEELRRRLEALDSLSRNFDADLAMAESTGWRRQFSRAIVSHEQPGPPEEGGPFERLRQVLENYEFSDPSIVTAHFDAAHPFEGRRMLLEIRVWGLRYLTPTLVSSVRDERREESSHYGFRYDTLQGHLESGWEWFLIEKDHETGEIRFSIEARWQQGEFPNLWSRIGFHLLARRMQRRWHTRAHNRMALLSRYPLDVLQREGGRISHEGAEIVFDFR